MSNKRVVILVDNKNRDLLTDALIAYNLHKMGVECFLEPLEAYKGCLAAHRPDMIVFNHLNGSHLVEYSKRLHELGVLVGVLLNEGMAFERGERSFLAGAYHKGGHIDYYFCWNRPHRDALMENGFGRDGCRLEVVGSPKFDFYFKPWSGIFDLDSHLGGDRKPNVLICTNFVIAKYKELPKEDADKLFAPWKDRIPIHKDYWKAIETNHASRTKFFEFLDQIVGASKYCVTLRPHPGEDHAPYRQWHENLDPLARKDVVLDTGSNITRLILSCDIEVSCETCTTAFESWIAGKPTVELVFSRHPMFFHEDIAELNVLCDNPGEIVSMLDRELKDPGRGHYQDARRNSLEKWFDNPGGDSSYKIAKIIAGALEGKKAPDWGGLSLDERRKGAKLKFLRAFDLPYNFDPLLFIKGRIFPERYSIKNYVHKKTIRPSDAAEAVSMLEKKCGGN